MPKKLALKDTPLSCTVEHNQLIIRIGVDTLAFADKERQDDEWGVCRIINSKGFAVDISHMMQREEEDGSSPLTDFLDKMMLDAINDGSAWVDYPMPK